MRRFGEVWPEEVSTEIGDVVIIGGHAIAPPIEVQGKRPPTIPATWWPWIIGAGALVGLWWLTKGERNRPLARGAG